MKKVVAVILLCQFNIPTLILSENECSSPRNCQPCQRMCGHKINPCKTKQYDRKAIIVNSLISKSHLHAFRLSLRKCIIYWKCGIERGFRREWEVWERSFWIFYDYLSLSLSLVNTHTAAAVAVKTEIEKKRAKIIPYSGKKIILFFIKNNAARAKIQLHEKLVNIKQKVECVHR